MRNVVHSGCVTHRGRHAPADVPTGRQSGHALLKLVMLTLVFFVIIGAIYYALAQVSRYTRCRDQLLRIYRALEFYEVSHGGLPNLAFFPDEPMADPDSIRVVLEAYGVEEDAWICPSSHPSVAHAGLSYLWNTRLNGANLRDLAERQWMLVEINALSRDVPSPHLGYYNVLFTDGTVERIRDPETSLRGF